MARQRTAANDEDLDPKVKEVVGQIQKAEKAYHNDWCAEVDHRHDEYHAVVEEDWDSDDWHTHIFPPHLIPIVEGQIASMVEPQPNLLVTPRPLPTESMEEIQARVGSSEIAEIAVNWALQTDGFALKQRPYIHQDIIAGFTWGKFSWDERKKKGYKRTFTEKDEYDEETGELQRVRSSEEEEYDDTYRDSPTFVVGDARDLFWPANCRSLDQADWIADRAYQTFERVQELEDLGVYRKGTTEKLKETSLSQQGKPGERRRYDEGGSTGTLRTKGLVEVIERWTPSGVCAVGNRQVLMREQKNPFWHGRMPYIYSTAIPNLFQVNGKSIVEVLSPIQGMLWFISNQSMDNLKLLNNLIYCIRGDVEDAASYRWYPGAQWFMDDPEGDVKQLPIDPTPSTISMQREAMLKGELQNLMGGLPGTGDVNNQTIDQKTATGISIITNIAQQVLAVRKMAYQNAFAKVGQAFLDLMQQFMLESRIVSLLGVGGARMFVEIDPAEFQGGYEVTYDLQGDSMVRQERRAEGQTLYQMAVQAAPIQAQFGTPLNLDAFMEDLLKSFDKPNTKLFFLTPEQQQAKMAANGQPGGGGGPPGMPGLPPGTPNGQGMIPPGMGPLGAEGNPVTAAPGPGVNQNGSMQQMMAGTGPAQ